MFTSIPPPPGFRPSEPDIYATIPEEHFPSDKSDNSLTDKVVSPSYSVNMTFDGSEGSVSGNGMQPANNGMQPVNNPLFSHQVSLDDVHMRPEEFVDVKLLAGRASSVVRNS